MKVELFPFQKQAVAELRYKSDQALKAYATTRVPQIVSLQAPTGSGKTVMMTAFIENVLFGDTQHDEQPNAVFVWLSDSPTLNEQSKGKIDTQSDRIKFGRTVIVADENFDRETFEDGQIYFINTQKLSKAGNLGQKSDTRNYTIWQTIQNTVAEKADRLYFIIDEAHRGMQGREGGRQTAIMQRFLKGWNDVGLPAMPLVIGMSATPERFHALVAELTSTIQQVIVPTDEVRASGLLKDRIIVKYPENVEKQDPYAVLVAATKEWQNKAEHWQVYCTNQHYKNVNPILVVQVQASDDVNEISATDLDAALGKISDTAGIIFRPGEVVHTFGSAAEIVMNGLKVPRVDPSSIQGDRKIRIVFFKENLSTGWDCPRAETMMSFARRTDHTAVAQLLGRMIRTPLQCHVNVDDSLNEVKLYLPYYDKDTVDNIIDALKSTECGEIPAFVGGELLDQDGFRPWTTTKRIRRAIENQAQMNLFIDLPAVEVARTESQIAAAEEAAEESTSDETSETFREVRPQEKPTPIAVVRSEPNPIPDALPEEGGTMPTASVPAPVITQPTLQVEIDRQDIIRRINQMGIVKYSVRTRAQRVNDYLVALLNLAGLLSRTAVFPRASKVVREEITDIIHEAIKDIHDGGNYARLEAEIREVRLGTTVIDAFGNAVDAAVQTEFAFSSAMDIERQLREAETTLCRGGIVNEYGRRYAEDEEQYKIDCIIFAKDPVCMEKVYAYAKRKFHELDDEYRKYIVAENDRIQNEYSDIVASGDIVSRHSFVLPESVPPFAAEEGKVYNNHLYADEDGYAKISLDTKWEEALIEEESQRNDFICWLRNKPAAKWALCLPYREHGETHAFYPDFMIVRRDYEAPSGYVVDVLEPHSGAFADNLAKAKGFAEYAKVEPHLGRIQFIRKEPGVGGVSRFRRLDFAKGAVREKILKAVSNEELDHIFETDGCV